MKLIFATNNRHKLTEVEAILGGRIELISLAECGITEDIPETSDTIEGNALQKARYVYEKTGLDCFADDTGLEVDALGGAPGVHSARYATDGHDFAANRELLLRNMEDKSDRRARFRTVIALILGGEEFLFEGIVEGEITREERGEGGFGYDPMFQPEGYELTFSELSPEEKNSISHRGRAVTALSQFLNTGSPRR
ncbi:MAG: non-canonical purine NTP diphosphatase [Tidjanibacter sp.]|nr:non-canonical purine NTP diphosphatase [Tidjanibacter sp.]